jgi:hypothetical protein
MYQAFSGVDETAHNLTLRMSFEDFIFSMHHLRICSGVSNPSELVNSLASASTGARESASNFW